MATDRRVELSSVRNARSLGGLHAASGRTAHGVFCRSDVPLSLTEEELEHAKKNSVPTRRGACAGGC